MTEADRMVELLRYASQAKVAKALQVSKTTTGNWAKGLDVTPFRLRQVEDLLRPQRAGELDPTTGELLTEMRAIRRLLQRQAKPVPADVHAIAAEVLRGLQESGVAGPAAGSDKRARAASRRRKGVAQEAASQ